MTTHFIWPTGAPCKQYLITKLKLVNNLKRKSKKALCWILEYFSLSLKLMILTDKQYENAISDE